MLLKDGDVVLFQGDSVTDAGRDRENPDDLGFGYPNIIASMFYALHPELNVKFLNRGISGNRVRDLKERWQNDCIDLKPTVVSILIGINDTWRNYDNSDYTSPEKFEEDYRYILEKTRKNLDAKIIIMEPFVLPVPEDRKEWRVDLDPKIHVVRNLSREFEAYFIPLDGIMAKYSTAKDPAFWASDGVHPTNAGHAIIAKEWLNLIKAF
ncbi:MULTISPECIES: SGNH/GDSL hydrolase family protein [Thermoanaerobacterium]|uniref:G-D-S-L family lipolytic protein n=2 Tax=Thermoanaerobacterium TaxID=28895 RepID=W9E7U7_9THEO|nr:MULTISPECIES: SGNH/GDSL hydrolase family protein [Thermoanaerobacterium]AFK87468.1 lipolytic protein G-D-S-L family [Thermoanaerobacterium saccharolyticum JW/SL-YS485]ETO37718.1 G-D-S-L family lipolytic protein [Thermoanaerobacterium aotearoense SCUT27]